MEHSRKRLRYLFQQYLANKISREEYAELWQCIRQDTEERSLLQELETLWEDAGKEEPVISRKEWEKKMQELIQDDAHSKQEPKRNFGFNWKKYKWAIAAAITLLLFTGYYFFKDYLHQDKTGTTGLTQKKDLLPGGNKAVLTLSNGSRIILDSLANGVITQQGKTNIVKSGDGLITYNPANAMPADVVYNMLSIPRGGKYQLTLPDGTKVWLNSASTLRFPTSFPGNRRVVEMTGEAYFEVAKNVQKPFIVKVNGMKVKVLGTHFNIMAYDDEPTVETTLLEGAVSVKKGRKKILLRPGQQARMDKQGKITVAKNESVDKIIAWKNNLFWFEENDIHEVMRQVSRWYDADVVIKGNIPQHFTGSIPRDVNVLKVFKVLHETGNIHFKIKDHKIIITP